MRLASLRGDADLYFDTGDSIKSGNLAVPLWPEAVWPKLEALNCTASVLGNRETHILESAFRLKLQGSRHPILCGNLRLRDGSRPLPGTFETLVGDVRIGVLAVMVPMVTEKMATQAASHYLWDPPIPCAQELAAELRGRVDLLIALTHIGYAQDVKLAQACPQIDLILGGHSHTVLENPLKEGHTWICQGGSHGRFAGAYEWDEIAHNLTGGHLEPLQ